MGCDRITKQFALISSLFSVHTDYKIQQCQVLPTEKKHVVSGQRFGGAPKCRYHPVLSLLLRMVDMKAVLKSTALVHIGVAKIMSMVDIITLFKIDTFWI